MMAMIEVENGKSKSRVGRIIREIFIGALMGIVWVVILWLSFQLPRDWIVIPGILVILTFFFLVAVIVCLSPGGEWKRTGLGSPYLDVHPGTTFRHLGAAVMIVIGIIVWIRLF